MGRFLGEDGSHGANSVQNGNLYTLKQEKRREGHDRRCGHGFDSKKAFFLYFSFPLFLT
jgi:hypothetical protein